MMWRSSSETISRGEKLVIAVYALLACVERLDHNLVIGIDANLGGNGHRFPRDRLGVERAVEKSARGGESIGPARADPHHGVVGLEHVAGPGQNQALIGIGHDHHGLESAQIAVGAPVLGSSTQARLSWSGKRSSLVSSRSNRVKASAVEPAKPAITPPEPTRRTLRAVPLRMVWPRLTWPSPAMTTLPPLRTVRIVVPCQVSGEDAGELMETAISGGASAGSSFRLTL